MQANDYSLAKLQAEGTTDESAAAEILKRADEAHEEAVATYDAFREKLPATLRKLTAGYELRTYCAHAVLTPQLVREAIDRRVCVEPRICSGFEIFECG